MTDNTIVSAPAGFFQADQVNNDTATDLVSAVALAQANVDQALASEEAAAASASAAAASATTALGAQSSATSASTAAASSASDASASATTATTQATNAGTSASAASSSATSAANSATTATSQASAASTSATAAAGSATSASTSATNASTQATNAANSASAASTSATAAATSATNAATSATSAAASAAVQATNTGRNLAHNGLFTIQQHGAGAFTTNGAYTADRWLLGLVNDANSVTLPALADADRTAIGDEVALWALQDVFTGSATANSVSVLSQRLEGVQRLSGKSVTLSFWAVATSGTPKVGVAAFQNFGTGGSPSSQVTTKVGTTAALSTTWTRYQLTWTMPTSIGKTFGTTAGTDFTQISLVLSDQANQYTASLGVQSGTVRFWGVQLEFGSAATAVEKRDPAPELALCQRFFQYHLGVLTGGIVTAGVQPQFNDFTLPVTMRAAPTAAFDTIVLSNAGTYTVNLAQTSHVRLQILSSASGQATGTANIAFSADL